MSEAIYWNMRTPSDRSTNEFMIHFVNKMNSHGAINRIDDMFAVSPLHVAAEFGHLKAARAIKYFMLKEGFPLCAMSNKGETAKDVANQCGFKEIAQIL